MNRLEKYLYTVGFVVLVLLFLLSSTDLFFQEKEPEVYTVSVIVDDEDDEFWINYKKGADQAAAEYTVDISFVTLYDEGGEETGQQLELIRREIDDGAQALVIAAADSEGLAQELNQMMLNVPVIAVQNPLPYTELNNSVLPDDNAMGQLLAEQIAARQSEEEMVYLIASQMRQSGISQRYLQLHRILTEQGFQVKLILGEQNQTVEKLVEQVTGRQEKCVMVGLEADVLQETAACVEAYYGNYLISVYGFGYNAQILSRLESECIDATVICDDYVMGYQSIQNAVACLDTGPVVKEQQLPSYLVTGANLYDDEIARIIFPIS